MKKKIMALVLTAALTVATMTGCGANVTGSSYAGQTVYGKVTEIGTDSITVDLGTPVDDAKNADSQDADPSGSKPAGDGSADPADNQATAAVADGGQAVITADGDTVANSATAAAANGDQSADTAGDDAANTAVSGEAKESRDSSSDGTSGKKDSKKKGTDRNVSELNLTGETGIFVVTEDTEISENSDRRKGGNGGGQPPQMPQGGPRGASDGSSAGETGQAPVTPDENGSPDSDGGTDTTGQIPAAPEENATTNDSGTDATGQAPVMPDGNNGTDATGQPSTAPAASGTTGESGGTDTSGQAPVNTDGSGTEDNSSSTEDAPQASSGTEDRKSDGRTKTGGKMTGKPGSKGSGDGTRSRGNAASDGSGADASGQPPAKPDGNGSSGAENGTNANGQPPAKPDGSGTAGAENGTDASGQPPAKPDGNGTAGVENGTDANGQPPARPDENGSAGAENGTDANGQPPAMPEASGSPDGDGDTAATGQPPSAPDGNAAGDGGDTVNGSDPSPTQPGEAATSEGSGDAASDAADSSSDSGDQGTSDTKTKKDADQKETSGSDSDSPDASSSSENGDAKDAKDARNQKNAKSLALTDIKVGDIVEITIDENGNTESIEIQSGGTGQGMPGGQTSAVTEYKAVKEYEKDTTVKGETIASTGSEENAVHASGGAEVTLQDVTVTRKSEDQGGDSSSFYGVGAAILESDGTAYISGSTIDTESGGGAGVFALGDGKVYVADTKITTSKGTSGGIHVAGGGTLYAWDLDVETEGGSSAAIRSDRGGGTMVVDGGNYTSNGTGSPAIYSTADITVHDAELEATASEAVCIEGDNTIRLYDCDLTGNMGDDAQNDTTWNVILYQSMSGDSEEGNSTFEMVGGTLMAKNGGMFYTTNTESTFLLKDVEITGAEDSEFLLRCTGNNNQRGWGQTGSNGADCLFTAVSQELEGNVIWDSISELDFYLTDTSTWKGAFVNDESNAGDGGSGYANLYIESGSTWTVTGDSMLSNLYNAGTIVDGDGQTVTVRGVDGTVYVEGTSSYTITVSSYSTGADLSGAAGAGSWSDYQVTKPEQLL